MVNFQVNNFVSNNKLDSLLFNFLLSPNIRILNYDVLQLIINNFKLYYFK